MALDEINRKDMEQDVTTTLAPARRGVLEEPWPATTAARGDKSIARLPASLFLSAEASLIRPTS